MPKANTKRVTNSPGTTSLQPPARCRFLHVIARSGAMGQSVTPAAVHGRKQRLRRIRKASRICPNSSQLARLPCGENGLPRQCAHWLAMTCSRKGACAGARTFGAQGAQKCGARQHTGSTPAAPLAHADTPQVIVCHCEERSDVAIRNPCGSTWQKAALKANT